MTWTLAALLALGGAIGTLARYAIQVAAAPFSQAMPWGTIGINIAGSFVIGFAGTLTVAAGRYPVADAWRVFIMAGLCGGFTTFSAFSLQTLELLRGGAVWRAGANVVLSVVACVLAVGVGHMLAERINAG